jgi:hypothetical protein
LAISEQAVVFLGMNAELRKKLAERRVQIQIEDDPGADTRSALLKKKKPKTPPKVQDEDKAELKSQKITILEEMLKRRKSGKNDFLLPPHPPLPPPIQERPYNYYIIHSCRGFRRCCAFGRKRQSEIERRYTGGRSQYLFFQATGSISIPRTASRAA